MPARMFMRLLALTALCAVSLAAVADTDVSSLYKMNKDLEARVEILEAKLLNSKIVFTSKALSADVF